MNARRASAVRAPVVAWPERRHRGQATVELALALPFVALLVLALVQVAVVAGAEVATINAAREGARAAAVGDPAVTAAAVRGGALPAGRVTVSRSDDGRYVTVTVRYRQATEVPLVGPLLGDVTHVATVAMRLEPR